MAPSANTVSTLNGMFKEVYADSLESLVPEAARLQRDFPFVARDKREGNQYHQPVRLTRAHGWTLSTSGDAFPLNPAEPARSQDATIQGSSFVLREVISYSAAAKLSAGKGDDRRRAFIAGTAYMIENMTETSAFILELQCLYGQQNIGVIESKTTSNGTGTETFVVSKATFIAAMWSGLEKGFIDAWSASAQLNLDDVQVTGVAVDTRSITLSGSISDMVSINAAITTGYPALYLRGTKESGMLGVVAQAANTGSMFGIDAANYSLWAGNTFSAAGGILSFAKVMRAMNKPVNRGLMGDIRLYTNPKSWTDCQNDLAALRRYADKAGGKLEQGADALTFYGQAGSIELVPHIFLKPSESVGIPKGKGIRLGASDLTFSPPGLDEGKFWENLPDHAGYGTRCFWNQAIFIPTPNQCIYINNIVNSDD
jgi:hypothetical protein